MDEIILCIYIFLNGYLNYMELNYLEYLKYILMYYIIYMEY